MLHDVRKADFEDGREAWVALMQRYESPTATLARVQKFTEEEERYPGIYPRYFHGRAYRTIGSLHRRTDQTR